MDHDHVLNLIITWAKAEGNVRALVLTGSAARGDAHELSELDIEVYAAEPSKLSDDNSWYAQFGAVLVVEALANPAWHPTRLIYYVGGKIDFMVAPIATLAASIRSRIPRSGGRGRLQAELWARIATDGFVPMAP
jgi:aminoglycoside 6-adenylyltransferase